MIMMKQIHYSIDNIRKEDAIINIIFGERSNGKSYAVKHEIGVLKFLRTGRRFILMRRWLEEITSEKIEQYFNDVDVYKHTKGKYNCITMYRKRLFLSNYNVETGKTTRGELIGYVVALSIEQNYAGASYLDVDDIIFGATKMKMCEEFSNLMQSEFEMSMMGELGFFLGLQIKQHPNGIFISQEKYVKDILKKYKMNEAKIMVTPMHPSSSLDKDESGKSISEKEYRGMIGSLLYLTASRPDIVFAVGLCARFQTCAKESHLTAVKRIFRYLVGTTDLGLWYRKGSSFDLVAYCDADYAGDKVERKSTSGSCQFLGEALIG